MGIYIKGMEMPKNCQRCPLYLQSMDSERNVYEGCAITQKQYNWGLTERPSDCPLVEVPPHGRLIDADAIPWEKQEMTISEEWAIKAEDLEEMPTVIGAEEETCIKV